jgi:hypothetical protein
VDPLSVVRGIMHLGQGTAQGLEDISNGKYLEGGAKILSEVTTVVGLAAGGVSLARTAGVPGTYQPEVPAVSPPSDNLPPAADKAPIATENIPIGTKLPDGRIAGMGPGAALADGADFKPPGTYDLVGEQRIERYQGYVDDLRAAGYSGERLTELQGRVEMMKEGYLSAGSSKLTGNLSNPGGGAGVQGFDQVFRSVSSSNDLAILESKYSAGFAPGKDPAGLLNMTKTMGRQMSSQWIESNISKMVTGPNSLGTNSLGWEIGTSGALRYMNVMNAAGDSVLVGLIF